MRNYMTKLSYDEIRSRVLEKLKALNVEFNEYYLDVNELADQLASRLKVGNQDPFRIKSNTEDRQIEQFEKIRDLLMPKPTCTFITAPGNLTFDAAFKSRNDGLYDLTLGVSGWLNRGDLYLKIDGRYARVRIDEDVFDSSYLVDFLASIYSCKVKDLASTLIENRMNRDVNADLSSADESSDQSAYEWFASNLSNCDLMLLICRSRKLDSYDLVEMRDLSRYTLDLSDCLQPRLSADTSKVIKKINQFVKREIFNGKFKDFDFTETNAFTRVIQGLENGQTEFEIEEDFNSRNSLDPDLYEGILLNALGDCILEHEPRMNLLIQLDYNKDSDELTVAAELINATGPGLGSNIDRCICIDGRARSLESAMKAIAKDQNLDLDDDRDYEIAIEYVNSSLPNADEIDISHTRKVITVKFDGEF